MSLREAALLPERLRGTRRPPSSLSEMAPALTGDFVSVAAVQDTRPANSGSACSITLQAGTVAKCTGRLPEEALKGSERARSVAGR